MYSFSSFINESKQVGDLYHWTSFAGVYMILEENYLKGANRTVRNDARTINRADEHGVSFTRDKTFYKDHSKYYPMEACIVIDGNKLSNNYKLFPYNDFYEGEFKPNYKGAKESDEMETRTNRSIEKIKNYIIRVELYHNTSGASKKDQLDFIKFLNPYKNIYKGFNVTGYTTIDEFKKELCEYIQSKGIDCIIKA
jgi:hypothetical protein